MKGVDAVEDLPRKLPSTACGFRPSPVTHEQTLTREARLKAREAASSMERALADLNAGVDRFW